MERKMPVMNISSCGCTDDSLCKEAKRLWKYKGFAGRRLYSYHRRKALELLHINGYDIRANNYEGIILRKSI